MHGLSCPTCGILVPRPGVKPISPALQNGFLTTDPAGKFLDQTVIEYNGSRRRGLPRGFSGKESTCHGQRSLAATVHGVTMSLTQLSMMEGKGMGGKGREKRGWGARGGAT